MVIKSKKDRGIYEELDEDGKRIAKLKRPWKNVYCKWARPDYSVNCKSSKKEDVWEYLVNTHLVEWYTTKLLKLDESTDEAREYIQEIWMQLLDVKQEKWDSLYFQGEAAITAFASGLIIRNCISNTSIAYKKIRGYKTNLCHFDSDIWSEIAEDENWKLPNNNIELMDDV